MAQQSKRKRVEAAAAPGCDRETWSAFMTIVPDDLLLEIFLRLPNGRDLIGCGAVCKRWFSLISDHKFIRKFTQYHHHYYPACYTESILFRYSPEISQPLYQLCSNKSNPIRAPGNNYLDFLPGWPDVIIRASCADLLLVSSLTPTPEGEYYVCNPLTKQWICLPVLVDCPDDVFTVYGLLCEPGSNTVSKFKVVLIYTPAFMRWNNYYFIYLVFCSETGLWTESYTLLQDSLHRHNNRLCPEDSVADVVTRNGVMYWLEGGISTFKGVVALDVFGFGTTCFINLPEGFRHRMPRSSSKGKVCLGLVKGRLQLAQLSNVNKFCVGLKVWELADADELRDSAWILVSSSHLKRKTGLISLLAFHPTNCKTIFVVCNHEIGQLNIEEGEYQKIGLLPGDESAEIIYNRVGENLKVFTLMLPLWPTQIPSI